jgi:hypothetical protein
MSVSFDPNEGLVVLAVQLTGPSGSAILRLALDTGATRTLLCHLPWRSKNASVLVRILTALRDQILG